MFGNAKGRIPYPFAVYWPGAGYAGEKEGKKVFRRSGARLWPLEREGRGLLNLLRGS